MANFWYTEGFRAVMAGEIDLNADDIRFVVCMTNTTADTERDKLTISGFTTLDEYDGGSRPPAFASRDALTSEAVNKTGSPTYRIDFDAADIALASLDAGTRAAAGICVYYHITNDATSVPLIWLDASFTGNGGTINLTVNANGLGNVTLT